MAVNSKIQWTDHSWNPWHGCKKVSPGCRYCYMFRDKERYGLKPTDIMKSKSKFNFPLSISKPSKIFTCSWSDFFIEEADEWRDEAWDIIKRTPHHIYQILTKRPERILNNLPNDWGSGYPNVWLGVSTENERYFNTRVPLLLEIPAVVKFISAEPLINSLNAISNSELISALDWIIIGGESGNENGKYKYRKCEISWFLELITTAELYNVPVFVKQLGTYLAKKLDLNNRHGGDLNEFPTHLQIREFPKVKQ